MQKRKAEKEKIQESKVKEQSEKKTVSQALRRGTKGLKLANLMRLILA
jgi:hypothetical protein